jgi:hypothetical protein
LQLESVLIGVSSDSLMHRQGRVLHEFCDGDIYGEVSWNMQIISYICQMMPPYVQLVQLPVTLVVEAALWVIFVPLLI